VDESNSIAWRLAAHRAITFGEDKQGHAVAGRIVVEDKGAAAQPSAQPPVPAPAKDTARRVRDRGDAPDGDGGDGGT